MAISKLDSLSNAFPATTATPTPTNPTTTGQTSDGNVALAAAHVGGASLGQAQPGGQGQTGSDAKQEISTQELEKISAALNHFMALQNADLQFAVHEKTQRVIVKLIDQKTKEVLKEFPPEEMLDMVAKFQEYVGMLIDKKA